MHAWGLIVVFDWGTTVVFIVVSKGGGGVLAVGAGEGRSSAVPPTRGSWEGSPGKPPSVEAPSAPPPAVARSPAPTMQLQGALGIHTETYSQTLREATVPQTMTKDLGPRS